MNENTIFISDFVRFFEDGSIDIKTIPEGLPAYEGEIPSPNINTKSEHERLAHFNKVKAGLYINGYIITSERGIKNKTFDNPGEKTTLKLKYRVCKNKKESNKDLSAAIFKFLNFIKFWIVNSVELKKKIALKTIMM